MITLLETFLIDHATLFAVMAGLSLLSMLGAVVGLPLLVLSLPEDYFRDPGRRVKSSPDGAFWRTVLLLFKNALGIILLLAGFLMLLLPGQGLLTMFGGLLLMDFPGKYRLERKLSQQKQVSRALAWMRRKGGKPPFRYDLG